MTDHRPADAPPRALAPAAWGGLALLTLVHGLLLFGILTKRLGPLFNDVNHRPGPFIDLLAYTKAGAAWLDGASAYGQKIAFGFRYHPLFFMGVGAPLSRLSPEQAAAVWTGVHEIALVAVLVLYRRFAPKDRDFLLGAAVLLLSTPFLLEVYMGNATFLAAALLYWACWFFAQRRMMAFSVLFFVSVVVKPLGLFVLPALLVHGGAVPVAAVLLALIVSAIPYFWNDPAGLETLYKVNTASLRGWVVHAGNQGAHNLIVDLAARLSGTPTRHLTALTDLPTPARAATYAWPALVAALATWATFRRREFFLALFLWSAVFLLTYKDVWEHTYSFAMIAFAWLLASRACAPSTVLAIAVWTALPTLFVFYDLTPQRGIDPEHDWSNAVSFLHHATKSVPLAALFLYVALGRTGAGSARAGHAAPA